MNKQKEKRVKRIRRHRRVRNKVFGTPDRPRLAVYRSLRHIYAQIIDDTVGQTLAAASTLNDEVRAGLESTGNCEAARAVGRRVAEKGLAHGLRAVVFDRGGYKYHGRVKALAEAAREAGLMF
ncbi:MAG: 50S ribosomal protein L18 [Planctomycetota bacterium]